MLFLRPTESLTIFLQQLGRGLRLAHGKECLTIEQKSGAEPGFVDFRESVKAIKENPVMAAKMLEVTDYLMSEVVVEKKYSPTTMYEDYALNEFL